MSWHQIAVLFIYVTLFLGSVSAMLWWQQRQRKTRLPFGDDLKLLRAPGETQLRLVRQFDEDGVSWMALAAFVPATAGLLLLLGTAQLPVPVQWAGLAVTLVAFVGSFIAAERWFAKKMRESSNRYLGYFGERMVAEHLEPLKRQGWRVLHDVPGEANGQRFNLDHVAIGPAGVFVVETKTRRKGSARPGFDDHKVYFDGRDLVWPWGEDNHGLEQAERNAAWLARTIQEEMGEKVFVTPLLALPGWGVEQKPSQDSRLARVSNPKNLPEILTSGATVLQEHQVAAIAAKLEARCRDVAF